MLALALSSSVANAACEARSSAQRTRLVELYTSEGCSSCPPADEWLARFEPTVALIPLALHVDYWDDLGWRDRFGDARFGRRQRAQVELAGAASVYTPQVFVDGREWRAWYRGESMPGAAGGTAPALHLSVRTQVDGSLKLALDDDDAGGGDWQAYFALVEDGLSSTVHAGENRGRILRHRHVVRAWSGPLATWPARTSLAPPADLVREHAAIVAFIEDGSSGRVGQALRLSLATCEGNAEATGDQRARSAEKQREQEVDAQVGREPGCDWRFGALAQRMVR